jgi:hypothetical protein
MIVCRLADPDFIELGFAALGIRNFRFDDIQLAWIVEPGERRRQGTCDSERLRNGSNRPIYCRTTDSCATARGAG